MEFRCTVGIARFETKQSFVADALGVLVIVGVGWTNGNSREKGKKARLQSNIYVVYKHHPFV
jgi:Rad3-related DNA helicase